MRPEKYFQEILEQLKSSYGEILLRDYERTLTAYNVLINREVFLCILEHCDFENVIPYLLKSDENKKNFS